ncbi:MAG TPA: multidrug effflux MFS transporter [Drouetiella sp.]
MDKHSRGFTVLLAGLGVLPPLSIDMGLPALAVIASTFRSSDPAAAMTLSLFLLGFAVAPLFCGPISDRVGRRPVLLFGCAAFALAAAGCTFAPSIEILLACRLIQGLGSGAATVLSTAIVRDLFEGHEAQGRLAQIGVMRSFAPMIAPTLGAYILTVANWRCIYGLHTVLGIALWTLIMLGFTESAKLNKTPLTVSALISEYFEVIRHRVSFGYAAMNALYFGAIFTYVTNSPLLMMKHFGVSNQDFGYLFAGTAFGIMCGAAVNKKMSAKKLPAQVSLFAGLSIASTAVLMNVILTAIGWDQPLTLCSFVFLVTFSAGLLTPTTAHKCIEPLPRIAGVVSAVMACSQMVSGAIAGMIVSNIYDEKSSWAMTGLMMFYVFAAAATYLFVVRPAERAAAVTVTVAPKASAASDAASKLDSGSEFDSESEFAAGSKLDSGSELDAGSEFDAASEFDAVSELEAETIST